LAGTCLSATFHSSLCITLSARGDHTHDRPWNGTPLPWLARDYQQHFIQVCALRFHSGVTTPMTDLGIWRSFLGWHVFISNISFKFVHYAFIQG